MIENCLTDDGTHSKTGSFAHELALSDLLQHPNLRDGHVEFLDQFGGCSAHKSLWNMILGGNYR